jgi:hypothetical protein
VRIDLAAHVCWNVFEERACELIDEYGIEVRTTDQQEIDAHSVQSGVLAGVCSAREQRSPQERIVVPQPVDLRTSDLA